MTTKSTRALTFVVLVILVLVNSGCQYMPKLPDFSIGETGDDNSTQQAPASSQSQTETTVEQRPPNPYLAERPSVPGEAKKRFAAAKQAMNKQQWSQAKIDLEWLVNYYPNLSGPHLNLALLYRQLNQPNKAESAFKRAIAVNRNNVNAHNQYAVFLREQGRFDDALERYQKALEIWPDHADAHRNLGILYDLYMGKPDMALPYYKRYQELLDSPDRIIAGWIKDTERRVKRTQ